MWKKESKLEMNNEIAGCFKLSLTLSQFVTKLYCMTNAMCYNGIRICFYSHFNEMSKKRKMTLYKRNEMFNYKFDIKDWKVEKLYLTQRYNVANHF